MSRKKKRSKTRISGITRENTPRRKVNFSTPETLESKEIKRKFYWQQFKNLFKLI